MKVSTVKKNPSRRSALRAEETRELIIQAAEREFAQKGFVPARLEDIAEAVGITRAAVIYHFNDKENLYNAVLEVMPQAKKATVRAMAGKILSGKL
jgi:AcrR family transcriptional regulator